MAHNEICVALRDETGGVLPLQLVSVWNDSTATTVATLYDSATATTPTSNPATTDASGVLHVWCDEQTLWYTTATQLTPLRLPVLVTEDMFNVRDFGAIGDGVTDDTAAFVAAIAAQRAEEQATYDQEPVIWHGRRVTPIYIPSGYYIVRTGAFVIDYGGAVFKGAGRDSTWLCAHEDYDDDIMFEVGSEPFTTDPWGEYASVWQGSRAQGAEFYDFSIIRTASDGWWTANTVERAGVGIQDNGAGGMYTWNMRIRGFQYGFASPYGHDFGYHYNLHLFGCDVGLYLAFGSEQAQFYGLDVGCCNENIVLESVLNVMFYGIDTSTPVHNTHCTRDAHDITFIGHFDNSTPSVMGVTPPGWGACRAISFYNLWQERVWDRSDDGGAFRLATETRNYIWIEGDVPPVQVQFYDPIISMPKMSGETLTGTDHYWLGIQSDSGLSYGHVNIYNPWFASHSMLDALFDFDHTVISAFTLLVDNLEISGTTPDHVPFWKDYGTEEPPVGVEFNFRSISASRAGLVRMSHSYTNRLNLLSHVGLRGIQLCATGATHLDLAYVHDSSQLPGLAFYPSFQGDGNAGLMAFGDCTSTRKPGITVAAAAPVSGTWVQGDTVLNDMSSTTTYAGWKCTVAGTPGTWVQFGALVP